MMTADSIRSASRFLKFSLIASPLVAGLLFFAVIESLKTAILEGIDEGKLTLFSGEMLATTDPAILGMAAAFSGFMAVMLLLLLWIALFLVVLGIYFVWRDG